MIQDDECLREAEKAISTLSPNGRGSPKNG